MENNGPTSHLYFIKPIPMHNHKKILLSILVNLYVDQIMVQVMRKTFPVSELWR